MTAIEVPTAAAMEGLGRRIGALLRAGDLVVLVGGLGAGKTTLTRALREALRVRGPITSPTFVLSRVHPPLTGDGPPLVHVDGYRLSGARELDDLDIDWDGSVAVVEWGEGLLDGVAAAWLRIAIDRPHGADAGPPVGADEPLEAPSDEEPVVPRIVSIEGFGARGAELAALLADGTRAPS